MKEEVPTFMKASKAMRNGKVVVKNIAKKALVWEKKKTVCKLETALEMAELVKEWESDFVPFGLLTFLQQDNNTNKVKEFLKDRSDFQDIIKRGAPNMRMYAMKTYSLDFFKEVYQGTQHLRNSDYELLLNVSDPDIADFLVNNINYNEPDIYLNKSVIIDKLVSLNLAIKFFDRMLALVETRDALLQFLLIAVQHESLGSHKERIHQLILQHKDEGDEDDEDNDNQSLSKIIEAAGGDAQINHKWPPKLVILFLYAQAALGKCDYVLNTLFPLLI